MMLVLTAHNCIRLSTLCSFLMSVSVSMRQDTNHLALLHIYAKGKVMVSCLMNSDTFIKRLNKVGATMGRQT